MYADLLSEHSLKWSSGKLPLSGGDGGMCLAGLAIGDPRLPNFALTGYMYAIQPTNSNYFIPCSVEEFQSIREGCSKVQGGHFVGFLLSHFRKHSRAGRRRAIRRASRLQSPLVPNVPSPIDTSPRCDSLSLR